eukprot:c10390_g1_i1 orf=634-939(-)
MRNNMQTSLVFCILILMLIISPHVHHSEALIRLLESKGTFIPASKQSTQQNCGFVLADQVVSAKHRSKGDALPSSPFLRRRLHLVSSPPGPNGSNPLPNRK